MSRDTDVLVIGCGIIGASVAWELARHGAHVRCLDPAPGDGATYAAAGMLGAVAESTFGEHELTRMNVESAALWPQFAAELEDETGMLVDLRQRGTLTVAFDTGDRQQLRRLLELQRQWGLDAREIDVAEAREMEPMLGPRISGAVWEPGDHQVNPRATHRALLAALERRGVRLFHRLARRLIRHGDAVVGVTDETGEEHRAGTVVLAAGWNTHWLAGDDTAPDVAVPTRPVKGQVIRLDAGRESTFKLDRVVRGLVQTRPVYLVPRDDGELVVGATSEELPDDRSPTAGGVFSMLRDARALVPGIDELPVTELTARARPGSPDNLPLIGESGMPGMVLATGHYRNGILLAPLTATAVGGYYAGGALPDSVAPASPERFQHARPTS